MQTSHCSYMSYLPFYATQNLVNKLHENTENQVKDKNYRTVFPQKNSKFFFCCQTFFCFKSRSPFSRFQSVMSFILQTIVLPVFQLLHFLFLVTSNFNYKTLGITITVTASEEGLLGVLFNSTSHYVCYVTVLCSWYHRRHISHCAVLSLLSSSCCC